MTGIFGRSAIWAAIFLAAIAVTDAPSAISTPYVDTQTSTAQAEDCARFLPYSSDPHHIWNRVHRRLLVRRDRDGNLWGCDDVDPLLWVHTNHLLQGHTYKETIS